MAGLKRDRRREWQRRKGTVYAQACLLRDSLRRRLGGKCICGALDKLEFHHPFGRDWEPNRKNLLQRMRLYWRDHLRGNLSLLCSPCNGRDGAYRGFWQRKRKKDRSPRKNKRTARR